MKYFVGIGGIGVSALARFYLSRGEKVIGSDACDSEIIQQLKKEGAEIFIGQKAENIPEDCLEIIHTPAAKNDNLEIIEAKKRNLKILSYPEALGQLSRDYYTIAIAGTHGKSTTTAMLGLALIEAGLDPTIIVGTKLKEFGNSNFRSGKSKYLVIEACEHEASFLNYYPQIAVVTNLEEDHLDYYKNLENLRGAFSEFASHVPSDGFLVQKTGINLETKGRYVEFSINDEEVRELRKIMSIPGDHNILNALVVCRVTDILGLDRRTVLNSLSKYQGSWRRFDIFNFPNFVLIDDYAHHPAEIEATLKSVREKYQNKRICCIYQPHQYQRTQFLFADFIRVFKDSLSNNWIDKLVLLEVYDVVGREGNDEIKKNYNSEILTKQIANSNCIYWDNNNVKELFAGFDVFVMMGAGDIYNFSQKVKKDFGYCCN